MKKEYALFWIAGTLFVIAGSLIYWKVGTVAFQFLCIFLGLCCFLVDLNLYHRKFFEKILSLLVKNCLFLLGGIIIGVTLSLNCFIELSENFVSFQIFLGIFLLSINFVYFLIKK